MPCRSPRRGRADPRHSDGARAAWRAPLDASHLCHVVVGGRDPGMVGAVTETRALDEMISEALAVIDKGLGDLGHRELVSSNEVADLLLDVRTLLATPVAAERDDVPVPS
jgi:hypothetical protein